MPELPDWLRAFAILGQHAGDYIVVATDDLGQLYALVKGEDGFGDLHTLAVDDTGQLIMVPRGEDGNYLAVDLDGYLTTVIKGKYEDELRTVVLDDDGRLSAFIIDSSDAWGRMLSIGNAELAARMGSPVRYDRRGQVQFLETFRTGRANWKTSGAGTGFYAGLSVDRDISDGYSFKMTTPSTGVYIAQIEASRGIFSGGKLGLELSYSSPDGPDYLHLILEHYGSAWARQAELRLDFANLDLHILQGVDDWAEVGDFAPGLYDAYCFNRVKVVADFLTGMYMRVLYNDQEFTPTTIPILSGDAAAYQLTRITVKVVGHNGSSRTMYLDDVILTDAEPT